MPSRLRVRMTLVPKRRTAARARRDYGRQPWQVAYVRAAKRKIEGEGDSWLDTSLMSFECHGQQASSPREVTAANVVRACRNPPHFFASPHLCRRNRTLSPAALQS